MHTRFGPMIGVVLALQMSGTVVAASTQDVNVHGAWRVDTYLLRDGSRHVVDGLIVFTERDWLAVYFVMGDEGTPQRGAGEGGPYTLDGDRLVLTRLYLTISSKEIGSLPEIPLRYEVWDPADAVIEDCRVEVEADRLTIHFPSGNQMGFARSSNEPHRSRRAR